MKITRVTCCLFLLLLSLVAFTFTMSGPKAYAASGQTIVIEGRGLHVESGFDYISPDGRIETTVYVDAFQNRVHNQTVSTADVFIGQVDTRTGATVLDASGGTDTPTFQIDKNLLSASLSATVPLTDNQTGQPLFNVSVNMIWTSTSAIQYQNNTFHYRTEGFTITSHSNAAIRDAIASGTVSDGTTNYTPSGTLWFAQIVSAKFVQVTITRS
jgi:hypothetical protein